MIIALYVIVLILTIVNHFVFKSIFENLEGYLKIFGNLMENDKKQNEINKKILNIMENDAAISKNLAERIAVLEKKLAEKETTDVEPDSLEDELDRNGGTISDEC